MVMAGFQRQVPQKKEVLHSLLDEGQVVRIILDARREGVQVPARFRGHAQLILEVGHRMQPPIPDLSLDEDAVRCTLSFSKQPFLCVMPWTAIFAVVGKATGRGQQWAEDIPPEVLAQQQPPPPPPQIVRPSLALVSPGEAPRPAPEPAAPAPAPSASPAMRASAIDDPPPPLEEGAEVGEIVAAPPAEPAGEIVAAEASEVVAAEASEVEPAPAEAEPRKAPVPVAARQIPEPEPAGEHASPEEPAPKPATPAAPAGRRGKRELPSYLRVIKLAVGTSARRLATLAALVAVALGAEFLLPALVSDSSIRQLLMTAAINVLIALSLNIINGMAGQFSIGHAGFVGVGAYAAAVVMANLHLRWPGEITLLRSFVMVPVSVGFGAVLAGFFGLLVGLPSLRLRGDYLAIVTLGFAEIFRLLIATAGASDTTGLGGLLARLGGQNGYAGPTERGIPQYAGPFWVLGAVMVVALATYRLKFSGWGRALRALREDEIAAAAVGVDPVRYKVTSFVLAAAGAGLAGGLLATMRDGSPITQPDQFNFQASFDAITMVILGGSGSVSGAVIGGLFVTFTIKVFEYLQGADAIQSFRTEHTWLDLNALRMVIYAATLIAVMIVRPEGLFGEREIGQRRGKVKAEAKGAA
jgi:branched-chain amino acid transport system permease protein